jgi:hypothetical protein
MMRRRKAFLLTGSISQMPLTGWGELCSKDPPGNALPPSLEVEVSGVNSNVITCSIIIRRRTNGLGSVRRCGTWSSAPNRLDEES